MSARHAAFVSRTVILAAAVLLAAAIFPAQAQMGIGIKTDREGYLQYEAVRVAITVRNDTGNSLVFSADDGKSYLHLEVADPNGLPAKRVRKADLAEGAVIGAGETSRLEVLLNDLYDIQPEGTYTVTAQIGHSRLDRDYRSESVRIRIQSGHIFWFKQFGVPVDEGVKTIPRRKVSLISYRDERRERLAVQVEDEAAVYGIIRLGPRIIGSTPECDVDTYSNIHLLYMLRPRLYEYRVLDCNLVQKQQRFLMLEETSSPHLQRDPDIGRIMVSGGRPAVDGTDYKQEDLSELEREKAMAREAGARPDRMETGGGSPTVTDPAPVPAGKSITPAAGGQIMGLPDASP